MKYRSCIVAGLGFAVALGWAPCAGAGDIDFQQDILPLLADRCFACHGPDANQRKAELRLDLETGVKKEVVVPGKPDESELLRRISTTDPKDHMPPPASEKAPLTPEEVALFRAWIAEGAKWVGHWAFSAPAAAEPPDVANMNWPRNEIDPFILARIEAAGLSPSPEADRETLIRRLSFDLTGLPPALAEIDRFVMDNSPDAYENLVDRLLASPNVGEHLARPWLDGARYADTNGYQNDFHRVMWPWRDWVIGAFNRNMPYDQFLTEQLAGDLLPDATESQRIATGFNRNNKSVTEGGSIEEEWLVENLVDRVETTSTVFLGLTMGCARCHDHKYDPITQKDFYSFFAFFNSSEDRGFYEETRGNTGPQVMLPDFEQQKKLTELDLAVNRAREALEAARAAQGGNYDAWLTALRSAAPAEGAVTPVYEADLRGALPAGASTNQTGQPAAPSVWSTGPLGASLALDGKAQSTLDLGQAVTFDREKPFTVALWVRPETDGALFSKMDENQGYRGVDTLVTRRGEIEVHIASVWEADALKVMSERVLELTQWSHLRVTYDGSSKAAGIAVYVNGEAVPLNVEKDALAGPIDTAEPLRIGQRTKSAYYKGDIAGLQFFDQVLPPELIVPRLEASIAAVLPAEIDTEQDKALRGFYESRVALAVKPQQEVVDAAQKARDELAKSIPSVMVMQERAEPRPTYRLKRGAYDAPDTSEQLYPRTPDFLPPMPDGAPKNRLGLAQWLTDPGNPLAARVAVNRFWQQVFGRGLVKTAEDFGVQGSPPTHPLLLDALAVHFRESGWDVKGLLKEMAMSATYRQSSAVNETLLAADPDNRLYARAPRYRFSAEMVRDNALAASGLLSGRVGGPPAMPYQPPGLWEELAGGASMGGYVQGTGEDLYRRSLYTHRKRTVPHPTLTTFDAPSFEICLARRGRTNTPLQALALLNDTTYVEAARRLAQRMLSEADGGPADRLGYGFRLATGRRPTAAELASLTRGYETFAAKFAGNEASAAALVANGESPVPAEIPAEALAAYMTEAGVLLNLDEAMTRE